jgi:hypothetical protein
MFYIKLLDTGLEPVRISPHALEARTFTIRSV